MTFPQARTDFPKMARTTTNDKLSTFEHGVTNLAYFINLEPNPLRTGTIASILVIISHLHAQSVLSFLNVTTKSDPFFRALLKTIDGFKISTYDSFGTTGLLRVLLWTFLVILNLSLVLGAAYIIKGSDRRLKRMVLVLVQSLQSIFEFLLLVPTLEYTFFTTVPSCDYNPDPNVVGKKMENNNQLPYAYGVIFYILVATTLLVSISFERVFLFSFRKHYSDRFIEQNKPIVYFHRVYVGILVIVSELVQDKGLDIMVLYGVGVSLAVLLLLLNLAGMTYGNTKTHLLNGYMMTWTLWHSLFFLIEYVLLQNGIEIGKVRSVIYLFTLAILVKLYGRIHRVLFNPSYEYPHQQMKKLQNNMRSIKLGYFEKKASSNFIRSLIEDSINIGDSQQKDFEIKCFILETVAKSQNKSPVDGSYPNLAKFLADSSSPMHGDVTQTANILEEFLLWAFESNLQDQADSSVLSICELLCYQTFYCRKPIKASVTLGKFYCRSQNAFKKALYRAFLRIIEEENVTHLRQEDFVYFNRDFFDGIKFDEMHLSVLEKFSQLKTNYQEFYEILGKSQSVSQEQVYKKGARHATLYNEIQTTMNKLLTINPQSPNALEFKINLLKELKDGSARQIEKLSNDLIQARRKLRLRGKVDKVSDYDFDHIDDNYLYVIVDVTDKFGNVSWCSSNITSILGYTHPKHAGSELSSTVDFTINKLLPPFMVTKHHQILKNVVQNASSLIPEKVRYSMLFFQTSEGFVVSANINVKLQTINSLLYCVSFIEPVINDKKYILISPHGAILGYSKALKDSLLPREPQELLGYNICTLFPSLLERFLMLTDEDSKGEGVEEERGLSLTLAGFRAPKLTEFQLKETKSTFNCEKLEPKQIEALRYEIVQINSNRGAPEYEVGLKIIKKHYEKHDIQFNILEISSITPLTQMTKIVAEKDLSPAHVLYDPDLKFMSSQIILAYEPPLLSEDVPFFKEEKTSSNRDLTLTNRHANKFKSAASIASSSKTAYTAEIIKKNVGTRWLSKKYASRTFFWGIIGTVFILTILIVEYYQAFAMYTQFGNNLKTAMLGVNQRSLWYRGLRDASELFMNVTGISYLNQSVLTTEFIKGPENSILTDAEDQYLALLDSLSLSQAVQSFVGRASFPVTMGNDVTSMNLTLDSFVLNTAYTLREIERSNNPDVYTYNSTYYTYMRENIELVDHEFSMLQEMIDSDQADNMSRNKTILDVLMVLGVLCSVAVAIIFLCEYNRIQSIIRRILKLFFQVPRAILVQESMRYSNKELKTAKTETKSFSHGGRDRVYTHFRPSQFNIALQAAMGLGLASIFCIMMVVLAIYIKDFQSNFQSAVAALRTLEDTRASLYQFTAFADEYFVCVAGYGSDCESAYNRSAQQYKSTVEAYRKFKNFVIGYGIVSGGSMFSKNITTMIDVVDDYGFCVFTGDLITQQYCADEAEAAQGVFGTIEYTTSFINQVVQNTHSSSTPAALFASFAVSDEFVNRNPLIALAHYYMRTLSQREVASFQRALKSFKANVTVAFAILAAVILVSSCVLWYILLNKVQNKIQKTLEILCILPDSIVQKNAQIRKFFVQDLKIHFL